MTKLKAKALLKLADILDANAADPKGMTFEYYNWGFVSNRRKPRSCGTVGCALGAAAISREFKCLSYRVRRDGGLEFLLDGKRSYPLDAAMATFGLDNRDALFLFVPRPLDLMTGPAAERAVARKIRRFVKRKVKASQGESIAR